jgi:isocitrate/isopropylmalate dehydrogenase
VNEARWIESAVEAAVHADQSTPDIGGKLGTSQVGDWVAAQVRRAKPAT